MLTAWPTKKICRRRREARKNAAERATRCLSMNHQGVWLSNARRDATRLNCKQNWVLRWPSAVRVGGGALETDTVCIVLYTYDSNQQRHIRATSILRLDNSLYGHNRRHDVRLSPAISVSKHYYHY